MAEIRPFRGVRYNEQLVKDLAAVICPPYDIITPQMEQELYHRNEYNFVRIEANREQPSDKDTDNKYTRSAASLEQWLKQGVLEVDRVPSVYLHDHYFTLGEKEYRRRGIIVCVKLEEWDKMIVRPHEGTQSGARSDRLNLLWACQANTSLILALFEDQGQQVSSLLATEENKKPIIQFGADGERHDIWSITETAIIDQISSSLAHQPLYIADGHHRYESALNYQHERRACSSSVAENEAFDFVMMELVDLSDPGIVILPPHRLIRGISKSMLDELMDKLELFFTVDAVPLGVPGFWQQVDNSLRDKTNEVKLALFGPESNRLFILSLRDSAVASQMMPYFHSELYKNLDVSIADHIILEKLLGLNSESSEGLITYSYDKVDALNKVSSHEYQLALLVSPIKVEVIKAMADAGDRMPKKSTYFYPKPPAGLVFYRMV